ncbi:MAG: RagB/SusD family nutrient uptake outer membrane protein [Bacteroidales bacterium]
MKLNKLFLTLGLAGAISFSSCSDDFFDTKQTGVVTQEDVDKVLSDKPEQLAAFVRGIQAYMIKYGASGSSSHDDFGYLAILHCADMMANDMVLVKKGSGWFMYDQNLSNGLETYRRTRIQWNTLYSIIAKANSMIDLLDANSTDPTHQAYLAQAYAYRALSYYTLVPFYQYTYQPLTGANASKPAVPLRLSTKETSIETRATVKQVYEQMGKDVEAAITHFEAAKGWTRDTKSFMNKNVAYGIAARYYLYTEQWQKAADAAAKAYEGQSLMSAKEYLAGFSDLNNSEWMWGMDIDAINTTVYASFFSHLSNVSPGYAGIGAYRAISKSLYDQIDPADMRRNAYKPPLIPKYEKDENGKDQVVIDPVTKDTVWVTNPEKFFNLKFGYVQNFENDLPYMRASEMLLIKAEAEARMGQNTQAAETLKPLLEKRYAAAPSIASMTADDVMLQRRIELWGEGFNLFDMKRTNTPMKRFYSGTNFQMADQFNSPIERSAFLLQLPLNEINENESLTPADQNPAPVELTPGVENP